MENRKIPALIALSGIIVGIVVFFGLGDDETADNPTETTQKATMPAEPEVPEIEIKGGKPVGGVQEIEVVEGDELRVDVTTDAPDELHLHGFDLYLDIVPGKTNELVVEEADIGGVLELESHTTGVVLAEISVVPN